jgi:hypothetical protein
MRNILKAASASVLVAGLFFVGSAIAAPIAESNALSGYAAPERNIELAQFVFGGHNYCWYDGGWRGPGWYWCGYAWRHGLGWGGGAGFHGWSHGGHGGMRGMHGGGYGMMHGGAMHGGAMRGAHGMHGGGHGTHK